MDARTAESPVTSQQQSWLQRERASGRFYDRLMVLVALVLAGMIGLSGWLLNRERRARHAAVAAADRGASDRNPASGDRAHGALRAQGRRAPRGAGWARQRPAACAAGGVVHCDCRRSDGPRRHLCFGAFPERARILVLQPRPQHAGKHGSGREARPTSTNWTASPAKLRRWLGIWPSYLEKVPIDDPQFNTGLALQTYRRSLNEAAIVQLGPSGEVQTLAVASGTYGLSLMMTSAWGSRREAAETAG